MFKTFIKGIQLILDFVNKLEIPLTEPKDSRSQFPASLPLNPCLCPGLQRLGTLKTNQGKLRKPTSNKPNLAHTFEV